MEINKEHNFIQLVCGCSEEEAFLVAKTLLCLFLQTKKECTTWLMRDTAMFLVALRGICLLCTADSLSGFNSIF